MLKLFAIEKNYDLMTMIKYWPLINITMELLNKIIIYQPYKSYRSLELSFISDILFAINFMRCHASSNGIVVYNPIFPIMYFEEQYAIAV